MAAYTTSQSGDWSLTATWGGSGPPGNGDTATINHAVTISDARIIGTSPAAGTVVLTCTANLTISSTGSLTLRGDMSLNACRLICSGNFTFDASLASSPSSQKYRCIIGTASLQTGAYATFTGTSGAHIAVSSVSGGGNGYFCQASAAHSWTGVMNATYTDFTRIGDSTNPLTAPQAGNSANAPVTFVDCLFNSCGGIIPAGNTAAAVDFIVRRCNFKNTQGTVTLNSLCTNATTGAREISASAFDAYVLAYMGATGTITNNVFGGDVQFLSGSTGYTFSGNLVYKTSSENNFYSSITDCYFASSVTTNAHFVGVGSTGTSQTISGTIFDCPPGTSSNGDCILAGSPGSAVTFAVNNCIILPTTAKTASGTLVSLLGNANITCSATHNTSCYQFSVGETYNAHSGMVSGLKSNIFWCPSGEGGGVYKIHTLNGSPNNDVLAGANGDYNCGYGLASGSKGKGYDTPMTVTPGAHDVDVNPQFVDPYRNIVTWDTSLGGAGTLANARTELLKLNTSAHNSQYTVANLRAYVLAGYKPTNSLLRNAGHDGVTIGACEYLASSYGINDLYRLTDTDIYA